MAKEKTEPQKCSGTKKISSEEMIIKLLRITNGIGKRINALEQRIDKIVDAISKSKRVKGL